MKIAAKAAAASNSLSIVRRSLYPRGSIQNFKTSARRNTHGTQFTNEPNMGGNVKANAAASHSSGRRGMLLSLLVLRLMLMVLIFYRVAQPILVSAYRTGAS